MPAQATKLTTAISGWVARMVQHRQMMHGQMGNWNGNHEFSFAASAAGDGFTFEIPSECWTETNFAGSGGFLDQTTALFDASFGGVTYDRYEPPTIGTETHDVHVSAWQK